MKLTSLSSVSAATLCATAFFLGSVADSYADKGGKGGSKGGGKAKTEKKGKPDKSSDKGSDKKNDSKKDQGGKHDKKDNKNDYKGGDDFFSYYKGKGKNSLPPGLQKKVVNGKGLPPGWKNKATKGWKIDDEYWGKLSLLDKDDLPPNFKHKDGVGSYLLGNRILQVNKDTKTVIDFVDLITD